MRLSCFFLAVLISCSAWAQEQLAPVGHNPLQEKQPRVSQLKTTALTLPVFEDFTTTGVFPQATLWADHQVYVNNTMCVNPVSRGVATFDAINQFGVPYAPNNPSITRYADSLTTQVIDLSGNSPADSIYLSFLYQPQGNGFAPETGDSLILFLKKKTGAWTKVWAKEGSAMTNFRQVMIPINDTGYFGNSFQFRFVNIASINLNDDVWNLDYIRVATGRNVNDTAISDVATTTPPFYYLNDLTYMPYRQFLPNISGERATGQAFRIRNNYTTAQNISYGYTAKETFTNTPLGNGTGTGSITAKTEQQFGFLAYTATIPSPGNYSKVVFEQKYYTAPVSGSDPRPNDTIVHEQIFDNYLAYDDGTAEKSYFLNLFATLPGKIAIEYHLNQPDTLRGVAIYFGRQVPSASGKFFSIFVNKDIAYNGGTDQTIYQQDLYQPGYADTMNHFWIYKFDTPVPMPAGVFYIGTIQPALSGSDSLYFGLDANRIGGNHLYYNVLNQWESSTVSGALMVRPLLGQPITGTGVQSSDRKQVEVALYPNPANNSIAFKIPGSTNEALPYGIYDMKGALIQSGSAMPGNTINISSLPQGTYIFRTGKGDYLSRKFVKL